MNKEKLFSSLRTDLGKRLHLLEDKPEETIDSTIKALWLMAAGTPMSAERAITQSLPELSEQQISVFTDLIDQRIQNTPLAYITHRQNFMGIELISDYRALIPRKETEILGKKALELSNVLAKEKESLTVIDTCCGAGNLGLAIAFYNPKVRVFSSDLSQEAVNLTKDNIAFLKLDDKVQVKQGDLLKPFDSEDFYEKVDILLCNPPYISSTKVLKMDQEIAENEPSLAFDGGMLGTKIVQQLIREAPKFLTKEGWVIFEIGLGQGEWIMDLCKRTQLYAQIEPVYDNAGNVRVIMAHK
jgi:release factor glutamine methyltransferase